MDDSHPQPAPATVQSMDDLLSQIVSLGGEIGHRALYSGASYECGVIRFTQNAPADDRQITHQDKDVICIVMRGHGRLKLGDTSRYLAPGDVCHIPARVPHDFAALGDALVLVYVQVGVPAS